MKSNQSKLEPDEINLIKLAQEYSSDDTARALLESLRWPNGVICPHCKHNEIYKLEPRATSKRPGRRGLYKCSACREQFTVTVGTIFEDSHIPLGKWLMAIFILNSSKKAVSAHQLHRMLGITYKSAWFMAHRLRFSMGPDMPLGKLLKGIVEVDETFVGGKGEHRTKQVRHTPVVALIERGGDVQARVVSNVTAKNLGQCLNECVDKSAIINTDEHPGYKPVGKQFKRHDRVNHKRFEYIRRNPDGSTAGVNYCESFFSLLKRGVYGAWHHVSREHLPKYANEFAFRWNTRADTDGQRFVKAIAKIEGKRLTYRQVA
jgi:transposase-like protein